MRTNAIGVLVSTILLTASHVVMAQGVGATNRYGGAAGGDRYGGAGARYGGGANRATPAAPAQLGRGGSAAPAGRGVAPAPLTRTTPGQAGPMGRSYQTAPVAAPVQAAPVAPAIPSDAIPFSSLPTDSKFYFVADANRSFLWVKISDSSASNTVNQKVANIPAATYVRAEAAFRTPQVAPERTAEQASVDAAYERRYGIPVRRGAPPAASTNAPPPAAR